MKNHGILASDRFLAGLYENSHHGVSIAQNVKIFKSLHLLNLWMDLIDILPDVRCWSEVLCCTILTHLSDLDVKVTDFEILS